MLSSHTQYWLFTGIACSKGGRININGSCLLPYTTWHQEGLLPYEVTPPHVAQVITREDWCQCSLCGFGCVSRGLVSRFFIRRSFSLHMVWINCHTYGLCIHPHASSLTIALSVRCTDDRREALETLSVTSGNNPRAFLSLLFLAE